MESLCWNCAHKHNIGFQSAWKLSIVNNHQCLCTFALLEGCYFGAWECIFVVLCLYLHGWIVGCFMWSGMSQWWFHFIPAFPFLFFLPIHPLDQWILIKIYLYMVMISRSLLDSVFYLFRKIISKFLILKNEYPINGFWFLFLYFPLLFYLHILTC